MREADRRGTARLQEIQREFRGKVERYLDQGAGACHLRRPAIAGLVAETLQHFDQTRYLLHDWVIMPNHVHTLVFPRPNHLLSDILKSWKQFTSRRPKALLAISGKPFWQRECYDHWVRSEQEQARISSYIRSNPVRAGLCDTPEEWRWSSAWRTV
ncbi:MAG TPA: transposase [Chthoniobacterales bacterium]|nr:transposase [Chthoniobacterales bacterium]